MILKSMSIVLMSLTAMAALGEEVPAGRTSLKIEELQPGRSAREIRNEIKELDTRIDYLGYNLHAAAVAKAPGQFTIGPTMSYGLTSTKEALKFAKSLDVQKRSDLKDELGTQIK